MGRREKPLSNDSPTWGDLLSPDASTSGGVLLAFIVVPWVLSNWWSTHLVPILVLLATGFLAGIVSGSMGTHAARQRFERENPN